jgi:hypothetical protein
LANGYVLLDQAGDGLVAIPSDHQNALLNVGYAYQWWIFAAMVPVGFWVLARREARGAADLERGLRDLLGGGGPADRPRDLADQPRDPADRPEDRADGPGSRRGQ